MPNYPEWPQLLQDIKTSQVALNTQLSSLQNAQKLNVTELKEWNEINGQWFKNSQLKFRIKSYQELIKF